MASKPPEFDPQQMSEQMKNSAQQIWQAGLGAFAQAQQEGSKVFEALVKDGSKFQETTLQAQAKMAEAAAKASAMANDLGQRASGQFDKLEGIFEERVAKALHSMGLPNAQDMADLQARVTALEAEVKALKAGGKG
jgi:poly(hydroxyalkanoate) granule-associated protein